MRPKDALGGKKMKHKIEELKEGIYLLKGKGKGSDSYLIRGYYGDVLIDSGVDQNFINLPGKLLKWD